MNELSGITVTMPIEVSDGIGETMVKLDQENKKLKAYNSYYENLLKISVTYTFIDFSKTEEKPTFDKVFKKGN